MIRTASRRILLADNDRCSFLIAPASVGLLAAAALAVFGLPPLDLHGFFHRMGVMDPACGLTRGLRAVARGRLREAWSFNPGSVVAVGAMLATVGRAAVGLTTGRWLEVRIPSRRTLVLLAIIALVVLEVNQQAHADLLMR